MKKADRLLQRLRQGSDPERLHKLIDGALQKLTSFGRSSGPASLPKSRIQSAPHPVSKEIESKHRQEDRGSRGK